MRLDARSFPYPVLGNRDDFVESEFSASAEAQQAGDSVRFSATVRCSNPYLNELTELGAAQYVLHIECASTMFRDLHWSSVPEFEFVVPLERLNDVVEVNVMLVAARALHDYSPPGLHPHYEGQTFVILPGNILAHSGTEEFVFDRSHSQDSLGALMHVMRSSEEEQVPMRINLEADKIAVVLSKEDYDLFQMLKHHRNLAPVLSTMIVLPALVEALRVIASAESRDVDEELRWVVGLKRRMEELGLTPQLDEALEQAQVILDGPINRAFKNIEEFADAID